VPDVLWHRLPAALRGPLEPMRLDRLTIAEWTRRDMRAYAAKLSGDRSVLEACEPIIDGLADEYELAGVDTMTDLVMHRGLAVSAADTNYRLPDITGYAAHVEVRSPFLDHRMVVFAATLPHEFKVGIVDGRPRPKYLPRRYYARFVGDTLAWSPKLGMGANLPWPQEFAHNAVFRTEMDSAYARLHQAALTTTLFDVAFDQFRLDVGAGRSSFDTAGTMMNGFMIGEWLRHVYARPNVTAVPRS
jgi:asparagine synthase (glutamine-hydrolysing)